AGLAGVRMAAGTDAAIALQFDVEVTHPGSWAGTETEGHDHLISRNDFFRSGNDLGLAATPCIRRAQLGGYELHAFDMAIADDLDRLAIEQEAHPFLGGIAVFTPRTGHVGFVAAIGTGHPCCALADCRAIAIHGRVPAA